MITRDEIISEMGWSAIADCISKDDDLLIRIENIVRLAEAAEREACAELCEQWDASNPHTLAAAIRARSEK